MVAKSTEGVRHLRNTDFREPGYAAINRKGIGYDYEDGCNSLYEKATKKSVKRKLTRNSRKRPMIRMRWEYMRKDSYCPEQITFSSKPNMNRYRFISGRADGLEHIDLMLPFGKGGSDEHTLGLRLIINFIGKMRKLYG
jgi:hypothetical protein